MSPKGPSLCFTTRTVAPLTFEMIRANAYCCRLTIASSVLSLHPSHAVPSICSSGNRMPQSTRYAETDRRNLNDDKPQT
ncbi:hypothetical protein AVEN_14573-1 [Araneus ventricosus]|uniref:Uncharacterized protein n=1 Tax=Araneus ventricosus TaxID=182803 RepID=A0A4Y2CH49_ARAVE|nr:hypothetical protein AVEN_14573-1 [Araneus ventricosus]